MPRCLFAKGVFLEEDTAACAAALLMRSTTIYASACTFADCGQKFPVLAPRAPVPT
jgi:hypothetical protein